MQEWVEKQFLGRQIFKYYHPVFFQRLFGCVTSCELLADSHLPFSFHIGHKNILSLSHPSAWDVEPVCGLLNFSAICRSFHTFGSGKIDCVSLCGPEEVLCSLLSFRTAHMYNYLGLWLAHHANVSYAILSCPCF